VTQKLFDAKDVHEGREQWPKMETCIEAGKGGGVKMPEFCERLLRTNTAHM